MDDHRLPKWLNELVWWGFLGYLIYSVLGVVLN